MPPWAGPDSGRSMPYENAFILLPTGPQPKITLAPNSGVVAIVDGAATLRFGG